MRKHTIVINESDWDIERMIAFEKTVNVIKLDHDFVQKKYTYEFTEK